MHIAFYYFILYFTILYYFIFIFLQGQSWKSEFLLLILYIDFNLFKYKRNNNNNIKFRLWRRNIFRNHTISCTYIHLYLSILIHSIYNLLVLAFHGGMFISLASDATLLIYLMI